MESSQCNCAALRSATRALSLAYDEVLRPSGLRLTQYSILARIAAVGPRPLNDLAEMLAMDRTTLGRNLKPLERDDLVCLEVGMDRRQRVINLTTAGRRALVRAKPLWETVNQRFEVKFGVGKAKTLRDTMKQIVKTGRELSAETAA